MDFGIAYFPTHDAVRPGAIARLVEEHGQDPLFFAEEAALARWEAAIAEFTGEA